MKFNWRMSLSMLAIFAQGAVLVYLTFWLAKLTNPIAALLLPMVVISIGAGFFRK